MRVEGRRLMVEWVLVSVVLTVAAGYAGWRIYRVFLTPQDPCAGCTGCSLNDPKRRNKAVCEKKQEKKFGHTK